VSAILLIARRRQRLVAMATGLAAVQNIVTNLFLIPRWSLDGAAFGTSLSQLLLTLPLAFYALREVA
jgi:O-antigen/teichoic acid export membrane protein